MLFKQISCFRITILFLIISQPTYSFITVGNGGVGAGCDFNNLTDAYTFAIVNNDRFIRVTNDLTLFDTFVIDSFISIKGGYDNCSDADSDIVGTNLTKWDGGLTDTVVEVNITSGFSFVQIENFEIIRGRNINFAGAGGIFVHGNSDLTLINTVIAQNTGNEGGGLRVVGGDASVVLHNSTIEQNSATAVGGGVYCENSAHFTMTGTSKIRSNDGSDKGGGIYANFGCQLDLQSGSIDSGTFGNGIILNVADFGGGIYLQNGADVSLTGDASHPSSVEKNIANTSGGGIYITGAGSTATLINTTIYDNQAGAIGGGIVVLDSASFTMSRLDTTCWNADDTPGNEECSRITSNKVTSATGTAGAGYIASDANVNIAQTSMKYNDAKNAALFYVLAGHLTLEGNLMVENYFNFVDTNNLFILDDNAILDFNYNTLTLNRTNEIFNLRLLTIQTLNVYNSIIWQQGDNIITEFDNTGGGLPLFQNASFDCNIVHETDSLNAIQHYADNLLTNPNFGLSNDYHLNLPSDAVDFCTETHIQSIYNDLNGKARGVDNPNIIDIRGPYDAGAFEQIIPSDIIFINGFD
jgi:hypothetical protein